MDSWSCASLAELDTDSKDDPQLLAESHEGALVVGPLTRWPVGPLPVLVRARQRPTAWPMATRGTIVTLATC